MNQRREFIRAEGVIAVNYFVADHGYPLSVMDRPSARERMARMRERRRRSIAIAKVRLGPVERKKLIALGYLGADVAGDKGPAFDVAAEAYLSDRLAEEFVAAV